MLKRKLANLFCTFAVFTIILFFIAVVSNLDHFDTAFQWDRDNLSLSVFGTTVKIGKKVPYVLDRLLSFNDLFFGRGFSRLVKSTSAGICSIISNVVKICFEFIKWVVTAK